MTAKDDAVREHLAELRRVFIDRYQLTEPYDSPAVADIDAAIKAGAAADLAGLRTLVDGYNLYKHHESLAQAALAAADAVVSGDNKALDTTKPINQQNKAELIATAEERGVEVPEGATVPQLRAALAPVGFEEENESEAEEESAEETPEEQVEGSDQSEEAEDEGEPE